MQPISPSLAVHVLGYPRLSWANTELKLPTQKALAILCYLAISRQSATREELADVLWTPEAKGNLRPELFRLRQLPGADTWLSLGETITAHIQSDLNAFERAVREERYADALSLHPLSEGLLRGFEPKEAPAFMDWLEFERRRVTALLRDALRGRAFELELENAGVEALDLVRHLLEFDPLDEGAYRAAMRLEYRRGHVQAALQYFDTCRRTLKDELETEPLPETLELAHEIQRGSAPPDIHETTPKRRIPVNLLRPPVLVGREKEWAQMEAAWNVGQTIIISGPPGVGKTRLMMDFIQSKGAYIVNEGRPGDKQAPYSSFARVLRRMLMQFPEVRLEPWISRELSRILPERTEEPLAEPEEQTLRLYEAIYQAVARFLPQLKGFAADDVQYFDPASFGFGLWYSARLKAEPEGRTRGLICFRQGEVPPEYEAELNRSVAVGDMIRIDLAPLGEAAISELLVTLDVATTEHLSPHLHRLTGGNPLFLVEVLKRLYEVGDLTPDALESITLPTKVGTVIKKRLGALSKPAFRFAQALAASQQEVQVNTLAAVLETSPFNITETLTELEDAQVVKDSRFVHDLLYETVLSMTTEPAWRLLHRRMAEVLVREGAEPARIAYHYDQAEAAEQAVRYWLEAAHHYQTLGLHIGALDLLRQAKRHATNAATRQEAQLSLVSSYLELGRYEEARKAVERLLREAHSPSVEARALELMAYVALGEGHLQEAKTLAVRSSELGEALGEGKSWQHSLLRARIAHRGEQHTEAVTLLEPLLLALQQEPPNIFLVTALSEVAAMYDSLGRSEEALPLHYQALELSHQLEAPHHQIVAVGHLVYCLIELGRPQDALAPGEAALDMGYYRYSDLLRIHLARAYLLLERYQDARLHYQHLCEHTDDPAIRAAAWARLAEVAYRLDLPQDIEQALGQAVNGLEYTDFGRAIARVAIATLRYGTEEQRERLEPHLAKLDIETLPSYLKDELKPLLN